MNLSGLIEINSSLNFKNYIKKIYSFPMLTEEEEIFHASRWIQEKDRSSAQILVTSHLKLVAKIAMLYKYRGCGLSVMDLISEGTIGLLESLKKFDLKKKCRFATYAVFYIKAKINDFIMNSFSLVKLSSSKASKKLFLKLKEVTNSVNNDDLERIASETGVSLKNAQQMKSRILGREISIDSNSFDNHEGSSSETLDKKLQSTLPSPEEIILENDEKRKYLGAIAYACFHHLDDQEKDIIANRILREKQMTLRELAEKYNISQERIRQKQEIALKKIRSYLEEKKLLENSKKSFISLFRA